MLLVAFDYIMEFSFDLYSPNLSVAV